MINPNFILVDDDKIMLFLIELEIKKHFKDATRVSFCKSDLAFNYMKENASNLKDTVVLLDLNMPVMDGFQLLRELNSFSHTLKVIIVTSSISDQDKSEAVAYPFVLGYINKPLKALEIQNVLLKN